MRPPSSPFTYRTRRNLAMSGGAQARPRNALEEAAAQPRRTRESMAPGTGRLGPTDQRGGEWQAQGRGAGYASRTGESRGVGAGQGAWTMQGEARRRAIPPSVQVQDDGRSVGQPQMRGHSGFQMASQLARQQATPTRIMAGSPFAPRFDWEAQVQQPEVQLQRPGRTAGAGLQTGTTGQALRGGDIDPGPMQRAEVGTTARGQTQAPDQPDQPDQADQPEEPPTEEERQAAEQFEQERQAAADWFRRVTGTSIEEWSEATGMSAEDLYGLLMSGYVGNMDYVDGSLQITPNYARLWWEAMRGEGPINMDSSFIDNLPDEVRGMGLEEFSQWINQNVRGNKTYEDMIDEINRALGFQDQGDFLGMRWTGGVDTWKPVQTLPNSLWALGRDRYRQGVDIANRAGADYAGGHETGGAGGLSPLEKAIQDEMAWLRENLPQLDPAATENYIRAQQREADIRNAQAMRAAMAGAARTGLAPGVSLGQQQQAMQQAGVEAANIRYRQQLQAEMQNFQAQMRMYDQSIQSLRQIAQAAQSEREAELALRQARELTNLRNRAQMELMQKQFELDNTFGLQTGLDLIGDIGGAAVRGITGGLF